MDFFEQQDQARKRTFWLVVLFFLAVVVTSALVYVVVVAALNYIEFHPENYPATDLGHRDFTPWFWDPVVFILSFLGCVALIGCSSLFRVVQLRRGGGTGSR